MKGFTLKRKPGLAQGAKAGFTPNRREGLAQGAKAGFTLLEILLTLIILMVGVLSITMAFTRGVFVSSDLENIELALNIASSKMEEIKDTDFVDLADSGPVADPDFPNFNLSVDAAQGQNPMRVDVTVEWLLKGGQGNVVLTTLVADF